MKYTIIKKTPGRNATPENKIVVSKDQIVFCQGFVDKHKEDITDYVRFAIEDNGFLCFSFCKCAVENTYKVVHTARGAFLVRMPRPLLALNPSIGDFKPKKQEDGWFVTDCGVSIIPNE